MVSLPASATATTSAPAPGVRRYADRDDPTGLRAHLDDRGEPRVITRRFVVDEAFHRARVDHYLKHKIPRLSRTKLQQIIKTQVTRADGRPVKPHTLVAAGDELTMRTPARPEPPCPRWFDVLYEDDHVMVIDKPAGLPMHASAKFYFNTLTRLLSERFPERGLQIAHRLDRETSGAVAVARGPDAGARLKRAFERHEVAKTYLAVAHGDPEWSERTVDLPLGLVADPDARIAIRMEVRDDALPAITRMRVLERHGRACLVECRPITGRQHQIRAHLAAIDHAIVGDKLYAHGDDAFAAYCDGGLTPELLARFELPRHALHAARIRFPHPATGDAVTVDSPLPADLRDYLAAR